MCQSILTDTFLIMRYLDKPPTYLTLPIKYVFFREKGILIMS